MNNNGTRQAPRWLSRSDAVQPFVATLCRAHRLDEAIFVLREEAGDLPIVGPFVNSGNACSITLECDPSQAWNLLQRLGARLDDCDVYLQPCDSAAIRLLMCDMDMTMVAAETLDEVAACLGLGERIAAITTRAMNGEIDFDTALRERIGMLQGHPERVFHDLVERLAFNPGAVELVAVARSAGVHCVLVSGGFAQVAEPVARELGFDEVHCNRLEVSDGRLTGAVCDPIVNADYKCNLLQRVAAERGISLDACCAIGDGANDLPMIRAAGLGIAYRGKPILRAASACLIDNTGLDSAIHFMRLPMA